MGQAPGMSVSLDELPTEVLLNILIFLDRSSLYSLLFTNRNFYKLAVPQLYRKICLNDNKMSLPGYYHHSNKDNVLAATSFSQTFELLSKKFPYTFLPINYVITDHLDEHSRDNLDGEHMLTHDIDTFRKELQFNSFGVSVMNKYLCKVSFYQYLQQLSQNSNFLTNCQEILIRHENVEKNEDSKIHDMFNVLLTKIITKCESLQKVLFVDSHQMINFLRSIAMNENTNLALVRKVRSVIHFAKEFDIFESLLNGNGSFPGQRLLFGNDEANYHEVISPGEVSLIDRFDNIYPEDNSTQCHKLLTLFFDLNGDSFDGSMMMEKFKNLLNSNKDNIPIAFETLKFCTLYVQLENDLLNMLLVRSLEGSVDYLSQFADFSKVERICLDSRHENLVEGGDQLPNRRVNLVHVMKYLVKNTKFFRNVKTIEIYVPRGDQIIYFSEQGIAQSLLQYFEKVEDFIFTCKDWATNPVLDHSEEEERETESDEDFYNSDDMYYAESNSPLSERAWFNSLKLRNTRHQEYQGLYLRSISSIERQSFSFNSIKNLKLEISFLSISAILDYLSEKSYKCIFNYHIDNDVDMLLQIYESSDNEPYHHQEATVEKLYDNLISENSRLSERSQHLKFDVQLNEKRIKQFLMSYLQFFNIAYLVADNGSWKFEQCFKHQHEILSEFLIRHFASMVYPSIVADDYFKQMSYFKTTMNALFNLMERIDDPYLKSLQHTFGQEDCSTIGCHTKFDKNRIEFRLLNILQDIANNYSYFLVFYYHELIQSLLSFLPNLQTILLDDCMPLSVIRKTEGLEKIPLVLINPLFDVESNFEVEFEKLKEQYNNFVDRYSVDLNSLCSRAGA